MFRTSVAGTAAGIEDSAAVSFHSAYRHPQRYIYGKSAAKANVSVLSFPLALKWCFRRTRSKGFYLTINRAGVRVERLEICCWGRGYGVSHMGIYCFLKKFENRGTISRRHGSGRPSKITEEVKRIVEAQVQLDEETTATQLCRLLAQQGV